jgi:hypothetical protein
MLDALSIDTSLLMGDPLYILIGALKMATD